MNSSTTNVFETQFSSSSLSYASVARTGLAYRVIPEGVCVEEPAPKPAPIVRVRRVYRSAIRVTPKTAWGRRLEQARAFLKKWPARNLLMSPADKKCYDRCRRLVAGSRLVQERYDEEAERRYWAAQRAIPSPTPRPACPTSVKQVKNRKPRPLDFSNLREEYLQDLQANVEVVPPLRRNLALALMRTKIGSALLVALWVRKQQLSGKEVPFPMPPRCLEPEMEEATAQGDNNLDHVQTSNVTLTEARAESTASGPVDCEFDWSRVSSDDVVTSISTLTDRFVPVRNFTWPRDAQHNNQNDYVCDIVLPKDYVMSYSQSMCDLPNALPFMCHMYSRFDMEIKVHVNCNKFQVGQLQGTFWYEHQHDRLFSDRNNIWCASQNHHILISAGTSNEATLRVPFVYRKSFMLNKKMPTMEEPLNLGVFRLSIMNPLKSTSTVSNKAYGTVFVKFSNASFTGMKSGALGLKRRIHLPQMISSDVRLVDPESGGDERISSKTSMVSTTSQLQSTNCGRDMFGESFEDLKDYCRRYQYYATYDGARNFKVDGTGKVCAVVPIMPQGLDLGISSEGTGGSEFVNFHRDGHIPIISSGFRYFRGGLRFKIVGPKIVKANMLVQHIPPLQYTGDRLVPCTSIAKSIDMHFHSYASYVQNLGLNNIVEIEIPYYNGACYTLLQNPKDRDQNLSDVQSFYDLGQLLISIDLVGTDPLSISKNWSIVLYYSFADDARCVLFQGFPPMVLLDSIRYGLNTGIRYLEPEMDRILQIGAMRLLDSVLPDANRDNPPDTSPAMPVILNSSHSWSVGTGSSEPLNTLRLDPRAQTRYLGGLGSNEMLCSNIANVWGFVKTLSWSNSKPSGTPLFRCDASPIIDIAMYKTWVSASKGILDTVALPPCAVLSSLFHYWRGDLEFRVEFICSQYHTGRLMLAYIPGQDTTVTLAQARASPHIVFTLNESDQCIFRVPYIADRPWWPRQYSYGDTDTERRAPSQLFIYILNPLVVMDNVPDTIEINMYMRGGRSFEVAIPAQPSIGLNRNPHYRVLPDAYYLTSTSDSYYLGYEHSFYVNSKYYGIFRYAATSEALAQFNIPLPKYRTKTIWTISANEKGPLADLGGVMKEVTAMVLVRVNGYIYGLAIPTDQDAQAILTYLEDKDVMSLGLDWDWKKVVNNLWVVDSSTGNGWSPSGLKWYPKNKSKFVTPEMGVFEKIKEAFEPTIPTPPPPPEPSRLEKMAVRVGSEVVNNATKNIVGDLKESVNESVDAIKTAMSDNVSDNAISFIMVALTNLLHVVVNFNVYSISAALVSLLIAFGRWMYTSYDKIYSVVERVVKTLAGTAKDTTSSTTQYADPRKMKGESGMTYPGAVVWDSSDNFNENLRKFSIRKMFEADAFRSRQKFIHETSFEYMPESELPKMIRRVEHMIPVPLAHPLFHVYLYAIVMFSMRLFFPFEDRMRYWNKVSGGICDLPLEEAAFIKSFPLAYEFSIDVLTSTELQLDVSKCLNAHGGVRNYELRSSERIRHAVFPENEEQVEISVFERDMCDMLSIIFSCVSQGMSYSSRPEHIKKKWKDTLFQDISLFSRGTNNVVYLVRNIFKCLRNMVYHVVDWVSPSYRAAKALKNIIPSLSIFVKECLHLVTSYNTGTSYG
ncbi:MAG: capsid protein [Sanya Ischnura senegalensis iflavirus 2]|nr:MAG: capsid protein [Sanya Ischnura senegalensis iflavirus 2]